MSIFSRDKKKDKLVLVFDIKSSYVGAALFLARESGIPKIIFSTRESISIEKDIEANRFLALTLKSLEIVVNRIFTAGIGAPEQIFCVLSSLLYVSQTRIVELKKNTPFVFTSKLADSLIKKEISLFEEEHLEKHLNSETPLKLIELKNIKTMLNGYESSNPLNQKAKELEMTIFLSMGNEQILGKIKETIEKHFHLKEIKFSSFVLSSFAVIRDMYEKSENFLLINIGGEVTDMSIIKKNSLRESMSFPFGLNFMIRAVATNLGCSLGEAESYISLFKDAHAKESVAKVLGPVIDKLKKDWLSKFQESLSNLSNDISIPATIYLTADKEMATFFSETIKTEQFNQYTLTESKFQIIFLGPEVFHGLAEFEKNTVRDTFLIMDSIYINRFLINHAYSAKMSKVEKI